MEANQRAKTRGSERVATGPMKVFRWNELNVASAPDGFTELTKWVVGLCCQWERKS